MRQQLHLIIYKAAEVANTLRLSKRKTTYERSLISACCFFSCLLLAFALTSCKGGKKEMETEKPTVSVTIEPYRYFVEQIAGDKVSVNVMVPAGSNPETYEPTPQQMVKLSNSAIYFKVGRIGFEETWMKKLTDNAPDMKVIDTSKGITPAKTAGGIIDPHTWMSCQSARIIADNICQALCEWMPKDSAYFAKRCLQFKGMVISKVEQEMTPYFRKAKEAREQLLQESGIQTTGLAGSNHKGNTRFPYVIYHPALTYFAKDHGFEQLPIEEEGREPSIAQLQALINRAKRDQIKTVFIQKEFANRNTQTFIDATGAHAIEINPLAYDWATEMVSIAKKFAESYGVEMKSFSKN